MSTKEHEESIQDLKEIEKKLLLLIDKYQSFELTENTFIADTTISDNLADMLGYIEEIVPAIRLHVDGPQD